MYLLKKCCNKSYGLYLMNNMGSKKTNRIIHLKKYLDLVFKNRDKINFKNKTK